MKTEHVITDEQRERRVRELLSELLEPENIGVAVELIQDADRGRMFLARFLASYTIRHGEAQTDALLDRLIERIDPPWWVPTGVIRRLLDSKLPDAVVEPVLRLILPEAPEEVDLYAFLRP